MTAVSRKNDSGMALIATLMVLMLASALMVGFFASITADQRASGIDRDQTQAYAAAHAGLEKLTTDLATLFDADFSPQMSQINALLDQSAGDPGVHLRGARRSVRATRLRRRNWKTGSRPRSTRSTGRSSVPAPTRAFAGMVTRYDLTATARSGGRRNAAAARAADRVDPGVPVRRVLGYGPELLRRRQLRLRRPRAHQRQSVPGNRREPDAVAVRSRHRGAAGGPAAVVEHGHHGQRHVGPARFG